MSYGGYLLLRGMSVVGVSSTDTYFVGLEKQVSAIAHGEDIQLVGEFDTRAVSAIRIAIYCAMSQVDMIEKKSGVAFLVVFTLMMDGPPLCVPEPCSCQAILIAISVSQLS